MFDLTHDDIVAEMNDSARFISSLFGGWNHGTPT